MSHRSDMKKITHCESKLGRHLYFDISSSQVLASYNLHGTFYIPLDGTLWTNVKEKKLAIMDANKIYTIKQMRMEIVSHSSTPTVLTKQRADIVLSELIKSRKISEI
jgi:hypothetical protein